MRQRPGCKDAKPRAEEALFRNKMNDRLLDSKSDFGVHTAAVFQDSVSGRLG